jgi:hypothetical protein
VFQRKWLDNFFACQAYDERVFDVYDVSPFISHFLYKFGVGIIAVVLIVSCVVSLARWFKKLWWK